MFELSTVIMPAAALLARHPVGVGDVALNDGARRLDVEVEIAAEEVARVDATQHEVGVGDRRLGASVPVTGRAGAGACALRADREAAELVDARDRAAAGADRLDIDHGDHDGPSADMADRPRHGLAAIDDRYVGAGAADVERDVASARLGRARQLGRADHASHGP